MAMPETRTIEEICALPRRQVEADLRTVQAAKRAVAATRERLAFELKAATDEEVRLTMKEQLLSLVAQMHRHADAGVPSAAEALRANALAAPLRRDQNISANALVVVQQAQGLPVRPVYVRERLSECGIEVDDKVVRNALRRWAKRGMLIKDGYEYRSPDSQRQTGT